MPGGQFSGGIDRAAVVRHAVDASSESGGHKGPRNGSSSSEEVIFVVESLDTMSTTDATDSGWTKPPVWRRRPPGRGRWNAGSQQSTPRVRDCPRFGEGDRISYIGRSGRLEALLAPTTEAENRQLVDRMLAGTNRRLDASSAIQQARVLDGTARLTAVIPPVSDRLSVTLRKYTVADETLASLVDRDSLPAAAAAFVWSLAQVGGSVLFSGPTGAGKTTAMSAFLRAVPDDMCIRMCEEVRELHIPLSLHSSFYEASGVAMDGARRYSLRDLIKVCLSQRVDLLCVGEVRGEEAYELTRAVNAGCPVLT